MTFVPTTRRALLAATFSLMAVTGAHAAGPKKIVLLLNGTTGDKSFFDSAANGMKLIAAKYGDKVQVRTIEMGYDQSKWQPTLDDIAGQDWDAVITGTYQMVDLITSIAPENPKKTFIIYDAAMDYSKGEFKNVYSITYKQNEGSYLAGMAGAGVAAANGGGSLGFLGGLDIPVINDFLIGYVAGAQAIDPKSKVAVSYIGSFDDAAKGKELALAQYRTGTEIGFNVAGQAGLGQLAAAKDAAKYAIGVDSDQSAIFRTSDPAIADRVVTSVLKKVDVSLLRAADMLMEDKLPVGHEESLGLAEGAVGIVDNDVYRKVVSADIRTQIATAAKAIAAGQIKVPSALGMDTAAIVKLRDSVRP